MSVFQQAVPVTTAEAAPARDSRELHATPRLAPFLALAGQLVLLLLVFSLYHTMERSTFVRLAAIAFGAFLVHYWLPFRYKEPFWVAVSIAGGCYLLPHRTAFFILVAGLVFFLILRSSAPFKWRVLLVTGIFAALIACCAAKIPQIPSSFYPVFGAIFMFRMITYAYDLAYSRERPRLLPFCSYFFILPNFIFALFPVIDFQTMRRTYYQRDIHDIAQQGIYWMARGAIQLMLYRLVVYLNDIYLPDRVTTLGALIANMVLTYLLYLNVSGQFHIAVGMLHLFGYDLPETNHRYMLASSISDFWRRINIYWKDFMVKIVYFPVYFRFRRRSDLGAQVIATAAVFVVTWVLHSYQFFWIRGKFQLGWPDTAFWGVLGLLVVINVLVTYRRKPAVTQSWGGGVLRIAQVLGTFALITTLWSLWSAPTVGAWIYLMTHWVHGT